MAQSILVFGSNKKDREDKIFENISNKKSPDVLIIECEKDKKIIGIEQIRDGIKFLQQKPFELKNKYLLIPEAYKLTVQAQNALLKTLEEPPKYAQIILGSKAEEDLLDTVVSRCKKLGIKDRVGEYIEKKYDFKKIRKLSIGEKFDLVEDISKEEKEDILEMLEEWIETERRIMENTNNIKVLLEVREDLELNINTKLALEYLMVNLE